jgi:predicted MPP superfamily phosphohydrolase
MNRRLSIFVIILFFLLPVAARAQVTGSFRFAQLTDIHLNPNNPKPTEDLKRSVEQINATPGVDFVLVTGDLTEEGDRTTMLVVKSILDRLKVKYYVIPGNHETSGVIQVALLSAKYSGENALNSNTKDSCF